MATLEELVLQRITVKEYYENNIVNYEEYATKDGIRFKKNYKYGFDSKNMAVCHVHPDRDPSMGLMPDKKNKGVLVYHCFGCGAVGNVVDMHHIMLNKRLKDGEQFRFTSERVSKKGIPYLVIERDAALKDLAKQLGISEKDAVEEKIDLNNVYIQKQYNLRKSMSRYTIRDFEYDLLSMRLSDYSTQNKIILLNRSIVRLLKENL